jgi:glucose/arabinose dehydrogenase
MKPYVAALTLGIALGLSFTHASAEVITTQKHAVQLTKVADGLSNLWSLAFLPDGRMLVTEKTGNMRIIAKDGTLGAPLKGVPEVHNQGQAGLLDVVLSPDFDKTQKIYFSYSEPNEKGENSTAVAHAILKEDRLEHVTRIFSQQPKVKSNAHFGSRIVFAKDGTLFVTLGDRYNEMQKAQTLDNHQGKVVRINTDGSAPTDNPFVKQKGALPEIWSYGHRNVQGAAINPQTGKLWTGEHGPQGGDELNIAEAGKNYGWPVITYGENYGGGKIGEGTHKDGMEQPVYKWVPSIATTGFLFYSGEQFPEWKNNIILTSLAGNTLVRLEMDGDTIVNEERLLKKELGQRMRSVIQGPDGNLYIVTDESNGAVYRLAPAPKS